MLSIGVAGVLYALIGAGAIRMILSEPSRYSETPWLSFYLGCMGVGFLALSLGCAVALFERLRQIGVPREAAGSAVATQMLLAPVTAIAGCIVPFIGGQLLGSVPHAIGGLLIGTAVGAVWPYLRKSRQLER